MTCRGKDCKNRKRYKKVRVCVDVSHASPSRAQVEVKKILQKVEAKVLQKVKAKKVLRKQKLPPAAVVKPKRQVGLAGIGLAGVGLAGIGLAELFKLIKKIESEKRKASAKRASGVRYKDASAQTSVGRVSRGAVLPRPPVVPKRRSDSGPRPPFDQEVPDMDYYDPPFFD